MRRPPPPFYPANEQPRPDLLLREKDLTPEDAKKSLRAMATADGPNGRGDLPRCLPRLDLPSGRGPVDDPNVAVREILQRVEHGHVLEGDREDWEALRQWWAEIRRRVHRNAADEPVKASRTAPARHRTGNVSERKFHDVSGQ